MCCCATDASWGSEELLDEAQEGEEVCSKHVTWLSPKFCEKHKNGFLSGIGVDQPVGICNWCCPWHDLFVSKKLHSQRYCCQKLLVSTNSFGQQLSGIFYSARALYSVLVRLDENQMVKLSDFGFVKSLNEKDDDTAECLIKPMPVRWMSCEAIRDRVFSTWSDVV